MRSKAFGVVALALLMVVSFASLAVAEETTTEASSPSTTIAPGSEQFVLYAPDDFATSLVDFVFYWGFGDQETEKWCPPESPDGSTCLDATGPHGQMNHGTFVSAFVHWLKSDDGQTFLGTYNGPRGQFVKQAANSKIGKPDKTDDAESTESEETDGTPKGWLNPHNPHYTPDS